MHVEEDVPERPMCMTRHEGWHRAAMAGLAPTGLRRGDRAKMEAFFGNGTP
jgi:hypothetical protein